MPAIRVMAAHQKAGIEGLERSLCAGRFRGVVRVPAFRETARPVVRVRTYRDSARHERNHRRQEQVIRHTTRAESQDLVPWATALQAMA